MIRSVAVVVLLLVGVSSPVRAQAEVAGTWEGAIVLPGVNLGITLHIKGRDTDLKATIDIPMQMAMGLPLTSVRLKDSRLHFELPAGPGLAVFEGAVHGDSIKGDFHQATTTSTFYLGRTKPAEPEVVEAPPPYRVEEVSFRNGDIRLAGTLTIPPGKGPFPAIILLTGSGAQNRDEELFGFRPFKILADTLTRSGLAVLRCDDRGVGGSTGSVSASTSAEFAGDALAMKHFLAGRSDINSKKIGFLGHSEGAIVAAMAAVQSNDVAFIVLMAGPSIPGDSIIVYQVGSLARGQGQLERDVQRAMDLQRRVLEAAKTNRGWEEIRPLLLSEMKQQRDRLPDGQKAALTDSLLSDRVEQQIADLQQPWFRFFISYDPALDLSKVRCPVLSLVGDLDQQVPPALNRKPMEEAFRAGGNKDFEFMVIPGANHLFQKAKTGSPMEYAALPKEFIEGLLGRVGKWLQKRVR
jgi:pimeloyl-ACP methyl ester carboxylesterase